MLYKRPEDRPYVRPSSELLCNKRMGAASSNAPVETKRPSKARSRRVLEWLVGGGLLLAVGNWLSGIDASHTFVCKHAPAVSWIFPWMSCDSVAGVRETPLYREQVQKFLIAARDGDEPFLRDMARRKFRLRAEDVCSTATALVEIEKLAAPAIEILRQSSSSSIQCSKHVDDIVLTGGAHFKISTRGKPLDQTLLELPFSPSKCPGAETVWLRVPPSLLKVIRALQAGPGMSDGFRSELDGYRESISLVHSGPREAFMKACVAQMDAERQGGISPGIYTLIAFESCSHMEPKGQWKTAAKDGPSHGKYAAACEARFEKWRRESVTKEPYGSHDGLLAELIGK